MATQPILSSPAEGGEQTRYVDWGAIFGGVAVATGISIVLFAFGSAIGFSMVSPYEGEGASKAAYFTALGLWTLWVVVSSFMAGGYIAGRLRHRVGDGSEHEVDVRDGAHGLIVWGVGIAVASLLLVMGASGIAGTTAKLTASIAAEDGRNDVIGYTVDSLFRTTERSPTSAANETERREVMRILTLGTVRGELSQENKNYLARLVSARTGMTQAQATKRVNDVLAEAKQKADAARKLGIVVGFFTAAALLVAGAAAAWAAALGGRHRDRGVDTSYFWRWG
jgi:hypothetical protein